MHELTVSIPPYTEQQPLPLNITEESLSEERKVFDDAKLRWKNVCEEPARVPKGFNIDSIFAYLTMVYVSANDLELRELNENIQVGTKKPTIKGREMYNSDRITLCEFASFGKSLLFRANVSASYADKKHPARYPCILIKKDGEVIF